MDNLRVSTGELQRSISRFGTNERRSHARPYLKPKPINKERLRERLIHACREVLSGVMRRNADVEPELIRKAEIRAVINLS